MSLLNTKHEDIESAALNIAANRASKCKLLRSRGHDDMADRYARNLFYDVREFVGTHDDWEISDQTCERLHEIVAEARGEVQS